MTRVRFGGTIKPLDRKLLRGLWAMRGQVLAVSLVVACGVALYVMMNGTLVSLRQTLEAYYDDYAMAHVWAPARRVPLHMIENLRDIPGVQLAEGRISVSGILDMPGEAQPVRAHLVSLPEGRLPRINSVYLKRGSLPRQDSDEILIADDFAEAYNLKVGDRVAATLYGVRRSLRISGIALAPEFIYSIAPGEMIPNPRRYSIMWMGYKALANAYDMEGAFNEAVLRLEHGAVVPEVLRQTDLILDPFGGAGAYHRDDQLSDEFLQSEFAQLSTIGGLLPPIFLGVAAFLLNMIITRIVEQEREQIGLMKAFGYRPPAIVFHYIKMAVVIVFIGVGAGWIAGARMGGGMARLYMDYYKFPMLLFAPGHGIYVQAALFAIVAGVLGVLLAVRKTIALRPAVAMAPPVPTDYSHLAAIGAGARWMDQGLKLMIRHMLRWPFRSALTCLGIAMGMAIMIGAQGSTDAIDRMIQMHFELVSRQDITIAFVEPQDRAILHEIEALDGVITVEPVLWATATLSHGHRRRHQSVTGVPLDADLSILLDQEDRKIHPTPTGLTLSQSLADALEAEPGDMVTINFKTGKRRSVDVEVMRIVSTYLGTPAYMEMNTLERLLMEGDRISGVYAKVDSTRLDDLYEKLKELPGVAAAFAKKTSREAMEKTMDETMGTMIFFNTLFSSLIAIGVVFSSARISFYERQREIASLRVLGFTVREVNAVLLGELAVLTFIALPLGAFLGYQLSLYLAANLSSELFRVPTIVDNSSFGYAAFVIVTASILSAGVIVRQVAAIDLVIALKTRE